jgi:WD40-like Beta Propeller Repeat
MNRDDDARFDDTLREFLRQRAADTAAVRDASAMSAAIALRVPGQGRARDGAVAGRLVLVATLTLLLLLAAATLFVGSQRPPVSPPSMGNGVIAYASQSGLSPVYLVRSSDEPRQIIFGSSFVCPTFSPDGTMLALGMLDGGIDILSINEHGDVGVRRRLSLARVDAAPHCPAWAPDSSAVAFLDGSTLRIHPLVGEPRSIAGWETAGGIDAAAFATDYSENRAVEWSPDGLTIAVARASGTWLVPIDQAAPRRLHRSPAATVSWSPDGTRLVVWNPVDTLLVISVPDGAVEATLSPGRQPVWAPKGDRIAYTDDESRVMVVGPDGADPRVVSGYGYNVTWAPDGNQLMYIHDVGPRSYALVAQAIDADGNPVGSAATIVPIVGIPITRSFPHPQAFTWQPVPQSAP